MSIYFLLKIIIFPLLFYFANYSPFLGEAVSEVVCLHAVSICLQRRRDVDGGATETRSWDWRGTGTLVSLPADQVLTGELRLWLDVVCLTHDAKLSGILNGFNCFASLPLFSVSSGCFYSFLVRSK